MEVLEIEYNGYKFKSILEARWAVFFDAAGIKYEYEPEEFELEDGTKYLPDFYLPEIYRGKGKYGLWVEVKSLMNNYDEDKINQFRKQQNKDVLVLGEIPNAETYEDIVDYYRDDFGIGYDDNYTFAICPICGKIGIEWTGQCESSRICNDEHKFKAVWTYDGLVLEEKKNNKPFKGRMWTINWNDRQAKEKLLNAFKKAHQACFEQQQNIKLQWEVSILVNKRKTVIPDCLKSCFYGDR